MVFRAVCLTLTALVVSNARAGAPLPTVEDSNLRVERIVGGLSSPTGIAFLPKSGGDSFVIEKDSGRVKLIENGQVTKSVLRLRVESSSERGLLGIALHPRFTRNGLVYLYHTNANSSGNATDNRISQFKWNAQSKTLGFERVIKKLPVTPGFNHDGGKIAFGPDKKLYAVIGDLNRRERTQNNEDSNAITRQGVVLRLNPKNGSSPTDNPFYSKSNTGGREALNDVYAYGVRNSFGLNFDPITGHLWDTENGLNDHDEINRVRRGMNSGWTDIMGPRSRTSGSQLVSLGKGARYRDPLFSWETPIGVTDLGFAKTNLGSDYIDSFLVGDVNTGQLYRFRLNDARTDLAGLSGGLGDRVADDADNQGPIFFGQGWDIATDIERGPGGIYVTNFDGKTGIGSLYRIRAVAANAAVPAPGIVPEPGSALTLAAASLLLLGRRRWARTMPRP